LTNLSRRTLGRMLAGSAASCALSPIASALVPSREEYTFDLPKVDYNFGDFGKGSGIGMYYYHFDMGFPDTLVPSLMSDKRFAEYMIELGNHRDTISKTPNYWQGVIDRLKKERAESRTRKADRINV
jgi:hypothetical protein